MPYRLNAITWKSFAYAVLVVSLASCAQLNAPTTTSTPSVLGIGSIDIGADTGLQTSTLDNSFLNFPSDLNFTATPISQLTFDNVNGVPGRFLLTRVQVRNLTGRTLDNVTFLALSVAGRDQSLTAYSRVLTIPGNPVTDPQQLYQIKPSQPVSLNGVTNASFVAFSEADLDAGFRQVINNIPGVNIAAILPYGFIVGDIPVGGEATLDLGFFIPDGNTIGRFSFRFVAVTDTIERFTQGINEITTSGNTDTSYSDSAPVRQRYGTPSTNKKLVLTGPYTRTASQADINSGIFELLPDIRIAGTAGNALATLFDSGSTALAQVQADNQPGGATTLNNAEGSVDQVNRTARTLTATFSNSQLQVNVNAATQYAIENIPVTADVFWSQVLDNTGTLANDTVVVTGDLLNTSVTASSISLADRADATVQSKTNDMFLLISQDPGQQRNALNRNAILSRIAQQRAEDMARRNYFSHTNPDGVGPNRLIEQAGYPLPNFYNQAQDANNVESILGGFDNAADGYAWWLTSGSHRPHLLGEIPFWAEQLDYGIGYVNDPNSTFTHYWVFITARQP
ncbi:MAG: CAP domain-containing protein [Deinococcota bacterium]